VDRVQQGRDLANKMWNASRLVLLNSGEATPEARGEGVEDRWIRSRLERTIASVTAKVDDYDFAHAALELYGFFWSEFCDWYLEIVKPRLYDGDEDAAANLLWVLQRTLALTHPLMPFVTEEIWSYLPGTERRPLVVSPFPEADETGIDPAAEEEVGDLIELTRSIRRWRDLVGIPAGSVLSARVANGEPPHELVGRLARYELTADGGDPLATIGPLEVLASEEVDPEQVLQRIEGRRAELRSEVERGERKLANEGFVAKAPPEVVEEERRKLDGYRAELEELEAP
jgi:valyl-tRNA synthetase